MILDNLQTFSDAQALTGSAASTNVIPLGEERRLGTGEAMAVLLTLDVAADATNSDETYSVQLQSDSADSFGSAASVGGALTITRGAAAGTKYIINIPAGTATEQYLRLYYTLGGTTPSVTVTAYLARQSGIDSWNAYPDNITIS